MSMYMVRYKNELIMYMHHYSNTIIMVYLKDEVLFVRIVTYTSGLNNFPVV